MSLLVATSTFACARQPAAPAVEPPHSATGDDADAASIGPHDEAASTEYVGEANPLGETTLGDGASMVRISGQWQQRADGKIDLRLDRRAEGVGAVEITYKTTSESFDIIDGDWRWTEALATGASESSTVTLGPLHAADDYSFTVEKSTSTGGTATGTIPLVRGEDGVFSSREPVESRKEG